jgi:oligoendopeptidase F
MNFPESAEVGWCRIPHFYTAFYVYQYATGISAATSLATQVRDEGRSAVDRVLTLFRSGGSDYPLNLLRAAGVDLTKPDAIASCMDVLDETVAQMEAIYASGAFRSTI